ARQAELLDSLVFRGVVEPGAAALAADNDLEPELRAQLRAYAIEAAEAAGTPAYRQRDSRLHLAIAAATGSELMMAAVTRVQADLDELLRLIPVLGVNIGHSTSQHNAIVAAILAGNGRKASRVMVQHCDDTAALLRGLVG
ncbi:MAG: FCD domain-containing protein, partial [Marmoricola sp.]